MEDKTGVFRLLTVGNVLMLGCCFFYLLWWILAFHPTSPVTGMASGWLLIPAVILGVIAAVLLVQGGILGKGEVIFFSGKTLLGAGAITYLLLLLVTRFAFQREVTTELLLIVGFATLVFWQGNALYSLGALPRGSAVTLLLAAVVTGAVSIVCYLLYTRFGPLAGYIDGMIPLVLCIVMTAVLTAISARAMRAQ